MIERARLRRSSSSRTLVASRLRSAGRPSPAVSRGSISAAGLRIVSRAICIASEREIRGASSSVM